MDHEIEPIFIKWSMEVGWEKYALLPDHRMTTYTLI